MLVRRARRLYVIPLVTALAVLGTAAVKTASVPTPEQFYGFAMGAEQKIAGWDRIVEYFQAVDRASDRVVVQELGKSTMGRPYIVAIVSSPDTMANLSRHQETQKKLADPRRTTQEEAERLAREGKAVVLVGTSVHSNEIGSSQMTSALLHRLASESSPWVDHVLKNVILLLVPSQNPDGQQMVADWYKKNVGTPFEDAPLPHLYHKYAGHDNNRDSYMLTQVETQYLTRLMYKDWLPEVYLDKHEMGSNRARIFVPPFKNPPNPNVDPLVWDEVNMLGQAMSAKLHETGKTGVIWGEMYTGFWQGANSTNPWWHNMIALLTETASARMATTLLQDRIDPDRPPRPRLPTDVLRSAGVLPRDPNDPDPDPNHLIMPAPTDVQYRMNYPQPWLGGTWSFADVIDYQYQSTVGLLEAVANNREMLKRNFYLMNRRTIDLYRNNGPYAYVVSETQRDPIAAAKLVELMQAEAAEVHVAEASFTADGVTYPEGSYVMLLAQPVGRWIKDLLEAQKYPDIRWPYPSAPIDRPYDVTAWSLGMLMGVETVRVEKPFDARLTLLAKDATPPAGRVRGNGDVFVLNHEINNSITAMNRLLREGAEVSWALDELDVNGRKYSPGAILVSRARPASIAKIANELHLEVNASNEPPPVRAIPIRAPRVAVFEPWGGNIDSGWTRWLLEQHEFTFTQARNADLLTSPLGDRFDVVILPEMTTDQILRGQQGNAVPAEYKGGIGEEGVKNLKEFIQAGGTVITLGNAAQFAIEQLGAPFQNSVQGIDPSAFFCPGSILRIAVDNQHPIGYGMPPEANAMFINNGGYMPALAFPSTSVNAIARYPQGPILQSGWIIGESRLRGTGAVLEFRVGRGRIIMHTFKVQNRAQTWGTFKLLFNSIFYGPAVSGKPPITTTQEARLRP